MKQDSLTGKTILLISPQLWGKMFLSKHHYAVELAKKGNKVYFLNPPDLVRTDRKEAITITPSKDVEGVFLIDHRLYFNFKLQFHSIALFHQLVKYQLMKIFRLIGHDIDVVWSFELGNLYPFTIFDKKVLKVFHPVDEPVTKVSIAAAKGADVIFSVTKEILAKYAHYHIPSFFINHGVTENFLSETAQINKTASSQIRIGFSGNLLRPDIDRKTLLAIIHQHPQKIFDIWGSFDIGEVNIGGSDDSGTRIFIKELQEAANVHLHGPVSTQVLAEGFKNASAFLICYDVQKDQSKGTNYHKVMEFLATGKVIISNNITNYAGQPELVQMIEERDNNESLPALFDKVMANLDEYNSEELISGRINFARENIYSKQVARIEKIIDEL